jgi:hypothetical protein
LFFEMSVVSPDPLRNAEVKGAERERERDREGEREAEMGSRKVAKAPRWRRRESNMQAL